jgi:histidinol-phosphate phosphatase family protein
MGDRAVSVLYLDLDGTVRKGFDELGRFVNSWKDVEVFPEVPQLMKSYKDKGWRIVAISNQGGISLGHMSMETCAKAMLETQKQCFNLFDKMLWCMHHPEAKDPEFAICWCRKPRAGLVVEAAILLGKQFPEYYPPHLALFVGDRPEDKGCAEAANIKFMDSKEWRKQAA